MSGVEGLLESFPCDLCGGRDEALLCTRRGVLTDHPFRVVRCRSCGLIYINPRLPEQAISGLYDESYYDGRGFDSEVDYLADYKKEDDTEKVFRPAETARVVREMAPPPAKLLDFGCGLGDFMRQARRRGYSAEGFEVSAYAAGFARGHGFTVYDSLGRLPRERYDIATAIEVLEHCSSPMKALTAIHRSLKPGGAFYYTTLAFDGFYHKRRLGLRDSRDEYIVPEGHIHFFSTGVMRSYFSRIGFSKVFSFEPRAYQRDRLFRLLAGLGLVDDGEAPATLAGKLSYYGARSLARTFVLRKRPLPLARK